MGIRCLASCEYNVFIFNNLIMSLKNIYSFRAGRLIRCNLNFLLFLIELKTLCKNIKKFRLQCTRLGSTKIEVV